MKKKFYLKEDIDTVIKYSIEELDRMKEQYIKEGEYDAVVTVLDSRKGIDTLQRVIESLRTFDVECEEQGGKHD